MCKPKCNTRNTHERQHTNSHVHARTHMVTCKPRYTQTHAHAEQGATLNPTPHTHTHMPSHMPAPTPDQSHPDLCPANPPGSGPRRESRIPVPAPPWSKSCSAQMFPVTSGAVRCRAQLDGLGAAGGGQCSPRTVAGNREPPWEAGRLAPRLLEGAKEGSLGAQDHPSPMHFHTPNFTSRTGQGAGESGSVGVRADLSPG